MGIVGLDLRPWELMYDQENGVIKLPDIRRIPFSLPDTSLKKKSKPVTFKNYPHEVSQVMEGIIPVEELSPEMIDIYTWASGMHSIFIDQICRVIDYEDEIRKGKAEDYKEFMLKLKVSMNSWYIFTNDKKEKREIIRKIILKTLIHKPKGRLTIKKLLSKMKDFESVIAIKQTEFNENLTEFLTLNTRGEKAELRCGHRVSKDHLVNYALSIFLDKRPYNYSCLCTICGKVEKLKSFPLNSGYIWTDFGQKIEVENELDCGKYSENKLLTAVDLCLINDYISFKFTCLMLFDYPEERRRPFLMHLFNEAIRTESLEDIAWIFRHAKRAKDLSLSGKTLKITDSKTIFKAVKASRTVRSLDVKIASMNSSDVKAIRNALKVNKTLETLCIHDNRLGYAISKYLCEGLKVNKTLKRLELKDSLVRAEGAKDFAEMLKKNKTLIELRLPMNIFKDEGVKFLVSALRVNKTLRSLNLDNNFIKDEEIKLISEELKANTTLAELSLSGNSIGIQGVKHISEMLIVNKALKQLHIARSNIHTNAEHARDYDIEAISEALTINKTLTELDIGENEIGRSSVKAMSEALKKNTTLTKLKLNRCTIDHKDMKAIGKGLRENKRLAELCLEWNSINDKGIKALCKVFKYNRTLKKMNLRFNKITIKGGRMLAQVELSDPDIEIDY
eukprot:TRINITY_DN1307_c0_g11_i1.p1 TRINITY_DN1307_c0_g11~~TRINITY_DN1307_c0_g11_i1.p1  ORF type:complete len:676 (+),score=107.84 TRINITY_DN1307_c0_g11_i1:512-2539(+)